MSVCALDSEILLYFLCARAKLLVAYAHCDGRHATRCTCAGVSGDMRCSWCSNTNTRVHHSSSWVRSSRAPDHTSLRFRSFVVDFHFSLRQPDNQPTSAHKLTLTQNAHTNINTQNTRHKTSPNINQQPATQPKLHNMFSTKTYQCVVVCMCLCVMWCVVRVSCSIFCAKHIHTHITQAGNKVHLGDTCTKTHHAINYTNSADIEGTHSHESLQYSFKPNVERRAHTTSIDDARRTGTPI